MVEDVTQTLEVEVLLNFGEGTERRRCRKETRIIRIQFFDIFGEFL